MGRRAFLEEGAAGPKAQRQGSGGHKFEPCQVPTYDKNIDPESGTAVGRIT